jgi:Na+/H+ antiporter NhaC
LKDNESLISPVAKASILGRVLEKHVWDTTHYTFFFCNIVFIIYLYGFTGILKNNVVVVFHPQEEDFFFFFFFFFFLHCGR